MKENNDLVEHLEVECQGLTAKIGQLLKWGAAIMLEMDACILRRDELTGQIQILTGHIPRNSQTLDAVNKEHIVDVIAACDGNKSQAARVLGLDRKALLRRREKYGLGKEKPPGERRKAMIKLAIGIILGIFLLPFYTWAAPFLVCDAPPADAQVIGVKGTVDGTDFTTPYTLRSGAVVVYDIGTLSAAKHSFTNLRFFNSRGDGAAIPFDLPALPPSQAGHRLVP